MPEGETPRSLTLYAFDTNVDAAKPGDKVTMTGMLELRPLLKACHACVVCIYCVCIWQNTMHANPFTVVCVVSTPPTSRICPN